ncbi:O146 family O-antigen flippase, partial [Escherichia coli]
MSIKMKANTSNTKRLFFNSIIMYLRMILLMLITLYISRVTINTLGIEKFGLYSVISGFVLLAGVFTNILESTSQRFLSKSLGEGGNVSSIFESCISTHIVLSLIAALLIEMLGVWFINYKLRQDVISINEVYIIFHLSVITFVVTVITSPFYAALISFENVNYYSIFTLCDVISKVVGISLAPQLPWEITINYAAMILITTLVNRVILTSCFVMRYPKLGCRPSLDFCQMKNILSFAVWNMWGGAATVLNSQGINIVINVFFGILFNSARAITSQINSAILQLTNSIQLALNPQIVKTYFKDNSYYLNQLIICSGKINVYLTLLIICVFLPNINFLLTVWLGNFPVMTILLIKLMFIELFINSFSASLSSLIQATGKIKIYQMVVGGVMLLNLPLCLLILSIFKEVEIVYLVAIFVALVCLVLRLIFVNM